jgi:hypothetical protein
MAISRAASGTGGELGDGMMIFSENVFTGFGVKPSGE